MNGNFAIKINRNLNYNEILQNKQKSEQIIRKYKQRNVRDMLVSFLEALHLLEQVRELKPVQIIPRWKEDA